MPEDENELGFATFFGVITVMCLIPLLYNIVKLLFFYKEEFKDSKSNCKCSNCVIRLKNYNKKLYKRNFNKYFVFKMIILLILFYWCYKCFIDVKDKANEINYKTFDPYEILNVSRFDSLQKIKKAYRKLVITKHPDKIECSTEAEKEKVRLEFIRIVKAQEILTDPIKKENWEKYGDPDGPQSKLRYVVPVFFLDKRFEYPIIFVFLFFILGLCVFVVVYLKGSDDYDENGNSKMNLALYYTYLNENTLLKHVPFIIGISQEFSTTKLRNKEEKELSNMYSLCKDYLPKVKEYELPFPNKKAITLIYAFLSRMNLNEDFQSDLAIIQENVFTILPRLFAFINGVDKSKAFNKKIKTMGYLTIKSLVEFEQCFSQQVWFTFSGYLQLPFITQDDLESGKKKLRKEFIEFSDFIKSTKDKKISFLKKLCDSLDSKDLKDSNTKENRQFKNEKIEEMIEVAERIPFYTMKSTAIVLGFDDIVVRDVVTITVDVERNIPKEGFLHSNSVSNNLIERFVVFLIDKDEKLLDSKVVEFVEFDKSKIIEFKFMPNEVKF